MFCRGGRWINRILGLTVTALGLGLMIGTLVGWGGIMIVIAFALIVWGMYLFCGC